MTGRAAYGDPTFELVVAEGIRLVEADGDQPAIRTAVRTALAHAPAVVVTELAVEMLEDLIRNRLRAETLRAERDASRVAMEAEYEAERAEYARLHPPKRPKRGTRAYREWVNASPENLAWEIERQELEAELDREFSGKINQSLRDYAARLRVEWTAELLGSTIAMPDGTLTTWGAATLDQHQERVAMFEANAVANAEGAARHLRAVADLNEAGVGSLNELAQVAA